MADIHRKYSATGVTIARAAASLERDKTIRNPDYLAIHLIPASLHVILKINPLRQYMLKRNERILPGSYCHHIARTKHFDEILRQSISRGITQLVILGAGLDTRAYRFKDDLKKVKVFEVDYPGTQAIKKAKIAKLKRWLELPSNVEYVPVDLNTQSLDKLISSGYSFQERTLFICEGVSQFITPAAVDKILEFVGRSSSSRNSIVLDYIYQSALEDRCTYYGAHESSLYVKKRGESHSFGIEEGKSAEFFKKRGFRILTEYTPKMLEQQYLINSKGKLQGKVFGYFNIVYAEKE